MTQNEAAAVVPDAATETDQDTEKKTRTRRQPPYHVILWNDEHHTYQYVMLMLRKLFGHPLERGFQLARDVDLRGRAIVLTTTREHAELKRDQIHAFGKDGDVKDCAGAMSATIEPAEDN